MIGWAVRQLVIWGGVALLLFAISKHFVPPPSTTAPALTAPEAERGAVPNALVFRANPQGHVLVDAYVNGAPVRFLVDTGATMVVLTLKDAAAVGFGHGDLDFTMRTSTANGVACAALRLGDAGVTARLSGWVHRKRDHGQLLFIDLRDHYGVTQCVIDVSSALFADVDALRFESVVSLTGRIAARTADTVNPTLATGEVELVIAELDVLSPAEPLPFPVNSDAEYPEDMRLGYRFLDLRRERVHANIMLRGHVIAAIRRHMLAQGFTEFQTPILTASSPEGARDYLVPSRLHPGTFYALPQAPQQFKQLLMVAGFDRYFQIAPCFRDEAARADRSPGEFYQLDFEMSFVTQEDVFAAIEPVLHGVFE